MAKSAARAVRLFGFDPKVAFLSHSTFGEPATDRTKRLSDAVEILKKDKGSDIGPVLNWNPQTGSLQLSQNATQKLLASLGGHVTQRRDTGLTVFFPISDAK